MTEPNMEWEEKLKKVKIAEYTVGDAPLVEKELKEIISEAISEAEIHGFCNAQNGYAEVVKKLSDDVEKAEQRGAAEERRRIVSWAKAKKGTLVMKWDMDKAQSRVFDCIIYGGCDFPPIIHDNK